MLHSDSEQCATVDVGLLVELLNCSEGINVIEYSTYNEVTVIKLVCAIFIFIHLYSLISYKCAL